MNDAALVGRLLDEYHERRSVAPADVAVIAGSEHEARVSYRLRQPDKPVQVIRAFRADVGVPAHVRGTDNQTVADWLLERARVLVLLESAGYPAPRPVRTRTGELVGLAGPWLTWATTFVVGGVTQPTRDQLRGLGAALGWLHEVAVTPAGSAVGSLGPVSSPVGSPVGPVGARDPVGLSPRHPAVAVPATLARLDAVAGNVPAAWQSMYATFRQTAEAVRDAAGSVPETLVHGEAWARNAVEESDGRVTLIDWETGGLGLAVLDLGHCLLECHLDSAVPDDRPQAWLISPDEDRIAAVAAGYASIRELSPAELALLPDAVRFSVAVAGAIHFDLALSAGVTGPTMDARLACLQNRLGVADEVAQMARRYIALST